MRLVAVLSGILVLGSVVQLFLLPEQWWLHGPIALSSGYVCIAALVMHRNKVRRERRSTDDNADESSG